MNLIDKRVMSCAEQRWSDLNLVRIANTAEQLGSPITMSQVADEPHIFHNPYTSVANLAGIMLMILARPDLLPEHMGEYKAKYQEAGLMIMGRGGVVKFDKTYGEEDLVGLSKAIPENYEGTLSPVDLEARVLENTWSVIPAMLTAYRLLLSGELKREEILKRIGLTIEELGAMRENIQAFRLAKTPGLGGIRTLKFYSPRIIGGEILPGTVYIPVARSAVCQTVLGHNKG